MRLVVQRTVDGLEIGGDMESMKEVNQETAQIMKEDAPDIYDMASEILRRFPRFKEVVINTDLSYYQQSENQECP